MSTLSVALAGLRSHLASLSGVSEALTDPTQPDAWGVADRATEYPPPEEGISCHVSLDRIERVGRDEIREKYLNGPALFRVTGFGNRVVTLTVQVSSVLADQEYVFAAAENLRSRLALPTSEDALTALGFGLESIGEIQGTSSEFDGRSIPTASVTCSFNFHVAYSDVDATTIETFEIAEE